MKNKDMEENKEVKEIKNENEGSETTNVKKSKKAPIILACITIALIAVTVLFVGWVLRDSTNYVLKINDEKISMSEFEMYLEWQKGYMQENSEEEIVWEDIDEESGVPYIDLAKDLTVELLTEVKVQMQEANKRDITLSKEENEFIEASVKYSLSQSDMLDSYDLTNEDWINIYKESQIINKLILEIANETLTPYDARHILLLTQEKSEKEKAEIKERAQQLLDKVLAGEDFAKLATENSEDGGSVNNGGLYEGVAKGAFVSEFENAALSLQDGQIYPELVETDYGYHIIKLEKKVSDSKLTQVDNNVYNNFLIITQDWIENAEIEKGQQFMLVR